LAPGEGQKPMRQGRCPRRGALRTNDEAIKVSQPALRDPHLQQLKTTGNSGIM
jgi:hypothetical protein